MPKHKGLRHKGPRHKGKQQSLIIGLLFVPTIHPDYNVSTHRFY